MKKLLVFVLIATAGGSVNAQTTSFFQLVSKGTPQQVQAAIRKGADVNARGDDDWTPLMEAAWYNLNPEVISTLLRGGADARAQTKDGYTALMYAAGRQSPTVITMLLKAGADVKAWDTLSMTALMWAAVYNQDPWSDHHASQRRRGRGGQGH